jgi:S-methylmethionine-dependent homocysteine/selenocysteine methylase
MSMAKLIRTAFMLFVLSCVPSKSANADFILSFSLTNISENYAVAKWKTSKSSTGTVIYG